jgi:outer membrane protein assembly factor BamB
MTSRKKLLAMFMLFASAYQGSAQTIGVPSSYDFGTRRTGSSNLWIMTIQNQGSQTLVVDSVKFSAVGFSFDANVAPLFVPPSSSRKVRVWFLPSASVSYSDTMRLYSNATNLPIAPVALSGQGVNTPLVLGTPFWTHTVPLHPVSNTTRRVRAVRVIGDISGDGKPDVIVCTDNYWTMALNGNASGGNDSLWAFNTYISNSSAGPVGSEGDYSYQKALAIANDLNNDGFNDVVIGTGGGNEHVYAISGKTGQMLWTFGTDHPDSFSLGDITGVDVSTDFNNDGIPDVIAASAATQSGGVGGRRSIYLFNGANGNRLWQAPALGFTHAVTAIPDISGDGIPDVIGTIGEPLYKASAYNGANGAVLWDYPLTSAMGGGKEVLILPVPGQTPDLILGAFWGPIFRVDGESGTMMWQRPTGGKDPTRLARLRDINNDGIDEIVASLLVGDALCLDGATGNILWSYPANSGMDITTCPDLNNDGYDEVIVASQNADVLILRGNTGQLLFQYPLAGSEQARSVAVVRDIDGNNSFEILAGSDLSQVMLLSGGLDAGTVSVGRSSETPLEFSVSQNYPNPFNPSTTIDIRLPVQSDFSLTIYDILGRSVRTYDYQRVLAGVHKVVWDGKDEAGGQVASGVYLYKLIANENIETRKLILLK